MGGQEKASWERTFELTHRLPQRVGNAKMWGKRNLGRGLAHAKSSSSRKRQEANVTRCNRKAYGGFKQRRNTK